MKYLLTLAFISLFINAQAQIPNGSFENWTPYANGEYPAGWTTSDSIAVAYGGGNSVYKGTDPYDGSFSMHLKSVQIVFIVTIKGPGVATNGVIINSGVAFSFEKGVPDTARSRMFTFWYKYSNSFNTADAGIAKVALLKWNSATNVRDTIASGTAEISAASSYTQFSMPLIYQDYVNQPDTSLIIFQSSRNINDPNVGVGNELIVDSLNFGGFVGIGELNSPIKGVKLFPVPAVDQLNVEVELNDPARLTCSIYDLNGRLIESRKMNDLRESFDVSALAAGQYLLKLSDEHNKPLYSTTVSIGK